MEYVYGAMLLHSAGKEISVENLKKVMDAGGVKVDEAKIKALIASLEGVNIEEAIKTAAPVAVAAAPAAAAPAGKADKKADKKEEVKTEEDAAAGLASLFG